LICSPFYVTHNGRSVHHSLWLILLDLFAILCDSFSLICSLFYVTHYGWCLPLYVTHSWSVRHFMWLFLVHLFSFLLDSLWSIFLPFMWLILLNLFAIYMTVSPWYVRHSYDSCSLIYSPFYVTLSCRSIRHFTLLIILDIYLLRSPVTGSVWPRGSQEVKTPRFHYIRHVKVVRLSASSTGRLYPQECSWYSFSLGAELIPGPWYGRKEICHWKIQWHHRESIPAPSD
jgi:hypothetical protein